MSRVDSHGRSYKTNWYGDQIITEFIEHGKVVDEWLYTRFMVENAVVNPVEMDANEWVARGETPRVASKKFQDAIAAITAGGTQ